MAGKPSSHIRRIPSGIVEVKAWTAQDNYKLLTLCERYTLDEISKRLGRGREAVKQQMLKRGLRPRTEVYSMSGAARATGYHRVQLERARDALGMNWHWNKHGTKGLWTITQKQLDEMCEYLKTEGQSKVA